MTDKQMADILADVVVLVDTREQKNQHVIEFFTNKEIPYIVEKLETADYSFKLPHYPELVLDNRFLVERKNSLDEIAGNFTKDRERFTKEFERIRPDQKMHLVVETATWKKVFNGSYRSQMPPRAMMASLLTFCIRYGVPVWFAGTDESPALIFNLLRYELLEHLKAANKF